MNKLINILLIVILSSCNSKIDLKRTNPNAYQLNGDVELTSDIVSVNISDSMILDNLRNYYLNCFYDEKCRLIKQSKFDSDSNLISYTKFNFSTFGVYQGSIVFDDKNVIVKSTMPREVGKDYIKIEEFDYKFSRDFLITFRYDTIGRLKKQTYSNLDSAKVYYENVRDHNGLIVERIHSNYLYDSLTLFRTMIEYLEFDKYNNWIKAIEYIEGDEGEKIMINRRILYKY